MINQWGTSGNAGFALPMEQAQPTLPDSQEYTLAWNPVSLLLQWVPVAMDASGNVKPIGDVSLITGKALKVNSQQVVSDRKVGWTTPPTGTPIRTTFDTAAVTLPQLAGAVMALIQDLNANTGHGLIGA